MQLEKIQRLLEWGKTVGAEIPAGIRFEYDAVEGIRCVCAERIEDPVLTIPADIIIQKDLIPSVFPEVRWESASNTWLKFLLAKLMYDKESERINDIREKFAAYLDCLPAVVDSPLVWNPSELSLLEGTNLGSSLRDKLHIIWKEWFDATQSCDLFDNNVISRDLELFQEFHQTPMERIYSDVISEVVERTPSVWYSFPAFLWSHLVFLSRAFPEYVLNNRSERHHVMLLPIVDLLNHHHRSKVEWSSDGKSFSYKHLGAAEKGAQLYNNYGAKGNEELLSGYGFVLHENQCTSVALKIKLPLDCISEILTNESGIELFTLGDYTTYAFEKGPKEEAGDLKSAERIHREGVTYLICQSNDSSIKNMLNLFAYLNKVGKQRWDELTPQFKGLQNLRLALNQKLDQVEAKDKHTQDNSEYPINSQRKQMARIYRAEQVSILKWALSQLKSMEKRWLSEHKGGLLTTKKILKYDPNYMTRELPLFFGNNVQEDVASLSSHQFHVLWILMKLHNKSFVPKHSWVEENYHEFLSSQPDLVSGAHEPEVDSFHSAMLSKSGARLKIKIQEVNTVYQFLNRNSFTRFASRDEETILVKN